jgi:Sushi repeat (SCR repeat)
MLITECGYPGSPVNGFVQEYSQSEMPESFPPGSQVTYQCHEQHQKLRGSAVRECRDDGTWTDYLPWCGKFICISTQCTFTVNLFHVLCPSEF